MKRLSLPAAALVLALTMNAAYAFESFTGPLGVLRNDPGTSDGYVLLTPENSRTTFLIDNSGNIVNQWVSDYRAFYAELLPTGNLARMSRFDDGELLLAAFGGSAGVLEEFDWLGNKVWEYVMHEENKEVSHHTFEVMPNGNYLILGWEYKTYDQAIAAGLDPNGAGRALFPDGLRMGGQPIMGIWPDFLREVDRSNGETVWEWHVWDHIGTGPDQIDINKYLPAHVYRTFAGPDWTHFNGVAYNPRTNQVCVTSRNLSEVYVIDYASGNIVYRWGNPYNYGQGKAPSGYYDDGDQKLFGPHAPDWTADNTITILDNGDSRPSGVYTRALELEPAADKVVWSWSGMDLVWSSDGQFYSSSQSGAQKIANGNWMITSTDFGHVVEVTPDKTIVWEFVNPVFQDHIYKASNAIGQTGDMIHKAIRYLPDYPGFQGKILEPIGSMPNWVDLMSDGVVPLIN